MLDCAERSSNEKGWKIDAFHAVLDTAAENDLACVGGQFQFRGPIGFAEMYWLNAESMDRRPEEDWSDYVKRANREVRETFDKLCAETDFNSEARGWKHIREAIASGAITDAKEHLYFVAYFNREPNQAESGSRESLTPSPHTTGHTDLPAARTGEASQYGKRRCSTAVPIRHLLH